MTFRVFYFPHVYNIIQIFNSSVANISVYLEKCTTSGVTKMIALPKSDYRSFDLNNFLDIFSFLLSFFHSHWCDVKMNAAISAELDFIMLFLRRGCLCNPIENFSIKDSPYTHSVQ